MHPLLILLLGTAVVVVCIIKLRIGAFFGLILAALLVSLLAPGELSEKIVRVVEAFGVTAGKIGLIIACAAVIGKCMMESGAADRIVHGFLNLFGEKRAPLALTSGGFVLSIPVFFDTVFYLLVPLARSLHQRTKKHYLLYILAIAVGGVVTHSLVPPTPGPIAMAQNLKFDLGTMIMMGTLVAIPCAAAGLAFAVWVDRRLDIPMRPIPGEKIAADKEPSPAESGQPPNLFASLLPVLLPVVLISANTIVGVFAEKAEAEPSASVHDFQRITELLGNPNIALLISAAFALLLYIKQRRPSSEVVGRNIESALMSAGIIILITAAGGAFGTMLKEAQIGTVIEGLFSGKKGASGFALILIAWLTSSLLKTSQGSGTVAMITASTIVAAMIEGQPLSIHPVYLALAIGSGSMCISWMNDSAFWIVSRMSGLTETETLKTWTLALIVLSFTGLLFTLLLAAVIPMPLASS